MNTHQPPDLKMQGDFTARLMADELLSGFGVTQEAEGHTEADIRQRLGPVNAGGIAGKRPGFLILVLITEDGRDEKVNIPGPQETFSLAVRVMEFPLVSVAAAKLPNAPEYIGYSFLVERIKALGHQFQVGTAPLLYSRATPYNDGAGTIGKDVAFTWKPAAPIPRRAAQPTIAQDAGDDTLTLSTLTAGATIFATVDGLYPCALGADFESVAGAPLSIPAQPAGTLLRATAYAQGMIPSGVSELLL